LEQALAELAAPDWAPEDLERQVAAEPLLAEAERQIIRRTPRLRELDTTANLTALLLLCPKTR
jgi:hypothetical protein